LQDGTDLKELLRRLPNSVTIIGGNLNLPYLSNYQKIDLLDNALYLAKNAAITAECALQVAAHHLHITFADSCVLILGWGRIGKCLAKLLNGLGAKVTVAARKESRRVMIEALGYTACDISDIKPEHYRLIINTVPAMLFPNTPGTALKIDLASVPGMGGRDILWARGLPSRLAPESSGMLIADSIMQWLEDR
jgi:dipicolinate synthase subunit A